MTLWRLALTFVLAGAAACSLACSEEEAPLTPEQAEAVGAGALLTVADLPGAAWVTVEPEPGEERASSAPFGADEADIPACESLGALFGDDEDSGLPDFLVETEVEYSSESAADLAVLGVTSGVAVAASEDDAQAHADLYRDLIGSTDASECWDAVFRDGFNEGAEGSEGIEIVELTIGDPVALPEGGFGLAFDVELFIIVLTMEAHAELVYWQDGPALGNLFWFELNSEVLRDNATALVEAAAAKLAAAVAAD